MTFLRSVTLNPPQEKSEKPAEFPFSVPAIQTLSEITFEQPITFFVGENGSGKSTLLEGLASAARLPYVGAQEGERDQTLHHARALGKRLKLVFNQRPRNGFFLRSEDFFGFAKRIDQMRTEMKQDIAEVERDFAGRSKTARGLATMALGRELSALQQSYDEGLDAQSHGESFFKLFQARFAPGGLYLLDEPEAPLSPMRQIIFLSMLRMMVQRDSQFIIATHSPILLAYPGARIYHFTNGTVEATEYARLEHVNITRSFLANPAAFLDPLFADADHSTA